VCCNASTGRLDLDALAELDRVVRHATPLSAGDLLLMHHSAGWYGEICGAAVLLGFVGYHTFKGLWSSAEKYVFQSVQEELETVTVHGVDITESALMGLPEVRRATNFAAEAHKGQMRRTQEPYVSHCLETGLIVEALMGPISGTVRARTAVIAAVLHDVVDDTHVALEEVQGRFGQEVAGIVSKVSQLSRMNQLLRRQRRLGVQEKASKDVMDAIDDQELRALILSMVDEPLVILIKLADRLHNMRTIYALKPAKQRAVAQETLSVWCNLAERLGMFALKAELEDLCFAVLQPDMYIRLYDDLHRYWDGESDEWDEGSFQVAGTVDAGISCLGSNGHMGAELNLEQMQREPDLMMQLLSTVPRFEAVTFSSQRRLSGEISRGLAELEVCARQLLQELSLESYAPGLDVVVQGRLKSLYSVHKKMTRKRVDFKEIYDARALRVVVDDMGGQREAAAMAACYRLLPAVHRLWRPIWGETDDYIANPKASGYQSLHTAVLGPSNIPLEIQIRTASMHEIAEYGKAAHWVYKESPHSVSSGGTVKARAAGGQPVLRIDGGVLRDGVIVRATDGGKRLLCASFMAGRLSATSERPVWSDYRDLQNYVDHKGWVEAGHGDQRISLEEYILCSDRQFHRMDHYGHILPARVQLLDMPCAEDASWRVWASGRGKGAVGAAEGMSGKEQRQMEEKITLLRSMLEWGHEVEEQAGVAAAETGDVTVLLWPKGSVVRLPRGTTAGEILAKQGEIEILASGRDGGRGRALVNVNNRLVPENTPLHDGDMVILSRDLLTI